MMNRKLLFLIAAFLSFSLFHQPNVFAGNRQEPHTDNWNRFKTDGYVKLEKGERDKREKAKNQARLDYLRDVLNLAKEYYVKDEATSKETEEGEKVSGELTSSVEDEVAFEFVRQRIVARTNLLENELKTKDTAYVKALEAWENQYRVNRTNELNNDFLLYYIDFNMYVKSPGYNPIHRHRTKTTEKDVSENFNDVDRKWRLVGPGNITFHLHVGPNNPGWNGERYDARYYFVHFWLESSESGDSGNGHSSADIHIKLTFKYTNQSIADRVNEEIRLCKQAVK